MFGRWKTAHFCILNFDLYLKSFRLRSNIKHSTQCFITRSNTSKFVKNTPLRVVFSTLFSVFDLMMKHCVSFLIYYMNSFYQHLLRLTSPILHWSPQNLNLLPIHDSFTTIVVLSGRSIARWAKKYATTEKSRFSDASYLFSPLTLKDNDFYQDLKNVYVDPI